MFKKQNNRRKRIILLWTLIWFILSIFFARKEVFGGVITNTLQELTNFIEGNEPTNKIFWWDALTENIYKKAIEWNKRKTAKATTVALDDIQLISNWLNIDRKDLLNVLYNSNDKVHQWIKKVCSDCEIKLKDINASYRNLLKVLSGTDICKDFDNVINRACVDRRVNSQFAVVSSNKSIISRIETSVVWEDLFINWVKDDSEYDLQIDIQNIWDLLFESFIAPIETVFYNMPQSYNDGNQPLLWSSNTNQQEEIITLLQNAVNQNWQHQWWTWTITNWWNTPTNEQNKPTTTNQDTTNSEITNQQTTEIEDEDLKEFFTTNSNIQNTTTQLPGIQWNICISGVNDENINTQEEIDEITEEELDEYLESVKQAIDVYDRINIENDIAPNITDDPNFDPNDPNQTNTLVEEYVETLFDTETTQWCFDDCSILPASERVICQIQCLCFTMTRPKEADPRLENMNEMLKLRFCMVPAKNESIPQGKNIYSLDDILTRIQTNMNDVVNGGDMIKFQKTKEFLENPIADFSFSKLFSFEFKINIKPMFNNKSAKAKADKKKAEQEKLEKITGQSKTAGENYNQYLVIADPIKNKIYKEYASSIEEYEAKYNKEIEEVLTKKKTLEEVKNRQILVESKKWEILDELVNFMQQNYNFWLKVEEELININNIVDTLQNKL